MRGGCLQLPGGMLALYAACSVLGKYLLGKWESWVGADPASRNRSLLNRRKLRKMWWFVHKTRRYLLTVNRAY